MTEEEALKFIKAIFKSEYATSTLRYKVSRKDGCNVRRWSVSKKKSRLNKESLIVKKKK
jgi:hypothetical protein